MTPDLREYDLILVNTSGGKDSSVSAWVVAKAAERQGVKDRMVLVHATFAEEWKGTVEIVRRQAEQLGLPFEVVTRGEGILDYALRRKKWPSPKQRWCTSDFKRAPIDKVITRLAPGVDKRMRVLNVMGIRAQESPARAKKAAFERDGRRTNGRRLVDNWLPIFDWTIERVWSFIRENTIPQHHAYALGMPRLSCPLCIFSPKVALVLAGRHNPELLRKYVAVEKAIGHKFKADLSLAEVLAEVESGQEPVAVSDWKM
jgi:3'-phosphoadenosine 5'-phosphosulfate sulfotransferase (PAPS reductase)/FAD synthetase